ncbi:MAG TPA: hypothetical protein VN597_09000 [Streptosporangiaceae bacterium]|nr:hypothetical protein [Streptosporangiaceae bacterium]
MSVRSDVGTGVRVRPRPGTPRPAAPPVRPGRLRPGRQRPAGPGLDRPGAGPPAAGQARPGGLWSAAPSTAISRTPFILFVTALLGGGLVCLLVINTILAAGAYQITSLQQSQTTQAQQVQVLRQQVAADSAPSVIARRARELGMVAPPLTNFVNLKTGRIDTQPTTLPGVPAVPGYTP